MKRSALLTLSGWLALAASVTVYVLLSTLTYHQPFHVGVRDLRVYRDAARRIIDRSALAIAALTGAVIGYAYVPERFMGTGELVTGLGSVAADPYVMTGLAVLAVAAVHQLSLSSQPGRRLSRARPVPQ